MRGGEFRGVAHEDHALEPRGVESSADRAHAPVHHVARRHDVRSGRGVGHGGPHEELHGGVVLHVGLAVRKMRDAAVPVAHEFAEAHIGDDEQIRARLLQRPHRALDHAVFRVSLRSALILEPGNAEEQHCGDARGARARRFGNDVPLAPLMNARHAGHRHGRLDFFADKQRKNQIAGLECRLTHHGAENRGRAEAAGALEQIHGVKTASGWNQGFCSPEGRPAGRSESLAGAAEPGVGVSSIRFPPTS